MYDNVADADPEPDYNIADADPEPDYANAVETRVASSDKVSGPQATQSLLDAPTRVC